MRNKKDIKKNKIKKKKKPLLLTTEQISALHDAMKYLATLDRDRATQKNKRGFSSSDSIKGHKLAEKIFLSYEEALIAFKLAFRYRKQLPRSLKKIIFEKPKEYLEVRDE